VSCVVNRALRVGQNLTRSVPCGPGLLVPGVRVCYAGGIIHAAMPTRASTPTANRTTPITIRVGRSVVAREDGTGASISTVGERPRPAEESQGMAGPTPSRLREWTDNGSQTSRIGRANSHASPSRRDGHAHSSIPAPRTRWPGFGPKEQAGCSARVNVLPCHRAGRLGAGGTTRR
jgi:hypothetical protein